MREVIIGWSCGGKHDVNVCVSSRPAGEIERTLHEFPGVVHSKLALGDFLEEIFEWEHVPRTSRSAANTR